jgi:hypothetical protein
MAAALLALAYAHQLPLALECVTRDAVQKPLDVCLRGSTVRNIIAALCASVPGCRVDFPQGLVDVYSAEDRLDPSDLFNIVVPEYRVAGVDTDVADMILFCTLGRQLYPRSGGCGGSTAGDQWGHVKITLEMHDAKIYQVLNAIVAKNGSAIWTPTRSSKTTANSGQRYLTSFWSIYPLDPNFEPAVEARVKALVAPTARSDRPADDGYLHASPSGAVRPAPTADSGPQPRSCCGPPGPTPPKE